MNELIKVADGEVAIGAVVWYVTYNTNTKKHLVRSLTVGDHHNPSWLEKHGYSSPAGAVQAAVDDLHRVLFGITGSDP